MTNDFWNDRNVFVTGATGFVGSNITKKLVENRANITILVRDIVPNPTLSKISDKINMVRGDLSDFSVIERVLNEYNIDTCFHLAAQAIVGTANRYPLSTFESNIKGTWNLLEAARLSSTLKRLIVTSSDKAYGIHEELPYKEEFCLQGSYPYDVSKTCADLISQSYFKTYGLPVAIIRCANIYGGGDLNFNRIIPDTIRSLFLNKAPILRSDGTPLRDYVYISDVVKAYMALGERLEKIKGEAFNFGCENPISVLDLVEMITNSMGKDIKPVILGKTTGEIDEQYLSTEKTKKLLGWEPTVNLEEGLKKTIKWYTDYLGRKK